jgi:hypothetical protein
MGSFERFKGLKPSAARTMCAVANKLVEEPAFAWWVRLVLRCHERQMWKVKSRCWVRTHEFGIEMPKSVAAGLAIDRKTGTDFWKKAIEKEAKNIVPAFEFRDDNIAPIAGARKSIVTQSLTSRWT